MGDLVIALTLAEVVGLTGGAVRGGDTALGDVVDEVVTDSREAATGALFVAIRGERHDGHDHIDAALTAGATAVLASRPPTPAGEDARRSERIVYVADTLAALTLLAGAVRDRVDPVVVAITGSVGKTTTKDLTAAAIASSRATAAAPRSFNNEFGVPLTCLSIERTTEVLVVEVGARGIGHIRSLMPVVRPDVAVVTAVAGAHLEQFGDIDAVAAAKGELVEALGADGVAVLNVDDRRVAAMSARTSARVLAFGRGTSADVRASDVRLDRLGRPRFVVHTPWGQADVALPLAGEHQVTNALAALAAAGAVDVPLEAAAAALADARVSHWRSQVLEVDGVVVLHDAYNANPTSVRAALRTLVSIARPDTGRTWAVLGVMAELGAGSDHEHELIGRDCVRLNVDRLVVVGRAARRIVDGADLEGLFGDDRWLVDDPDEALAILRSHVRSGDVVLVKGSRVAGFERVADGLVAQGVAA